MKTDRISISNVHSEYANTYRNILGHIWSSLGSTGFAERNLSVNFTKAYEKMATDLHQDVIVWFEFQITGSSGKNDNHIDALLVNYSEKEIYLIESKRFSNPPRKKAEMLDDISRMTEGNIEAIFDGRIENIQEYKIYGCILADVWDESDEKIRISGVFEKHNRKCVNGVDFFQDLFEGEHKKYQGIEQCLNGEVQVFRDKLYPIPRTEHSNFLASFMWEIL